MAKSKYRLKKGPDISDFVCESIDAMGDRLKITYNYFVLRSEAREFAKSRYALGFRVRTFKISYKLVSDTKRKGAKGRK